jgi:enoyl-[acyl-carrier protein] reductase I
MSTSAGQRTAPLAGRSYLVTGISDEASLAAEIARELAREGAVVVCSGLGPTPHHEALSARARDHLASNFESFRKTVEREVGPRALALACDLTLDASLRDLAGELGRRGIALDGFVHAVARDRTLGRGGASPLLEVSREAFLDCLDVSAYSLIALARELLAAGVLARGASVVSLSYLGAERVVAHPYKNVAVAKAALERVTVELAHELGVSHGIRVNAVRFSPYAASRAGGAIPGLAEAEAASDEASALGNARPGDLAREVVHLLRPGHAITGEVRNVDGGLHLLAAGAGGPGDS